MYRILIHHLKSNPHPTMTDLNEKLKLVAEYDGYEVLETGTVTLGQLKKNQTIIPLCDYDSDYQRQIPVWQKVYKEIFDYDYINKLIEFDRARKISNLYKNMVNNGTPLESFEILVQAIQFINKMKK